MTVEMERDGKRADVHPKEVENMSKAGWTVVEKPKPEPKKSVKK